MFRKLAALSVITLLTAATPADLAGDRYSPVVLERLPAEDLAAIAAGDHVVVIACQPTYRTVAC